MMRCAITDRTIFPGDEEARLDALVRQAAHWSQDGIELIQLREKDLPAPILTDLARRMLEVISPERSILIVNTNLEAAIAAHSPGFHFRNRPGGHTLPEVIRRYAEAELPQPIVTMSCHSLEEIQQIQRYASIPPDAILFAPVFGKVIAGKTVTPAAGLSALREACRVAEPIPVLALGGVTLGRAQMCLDVGAAGIAGIRIFHDNL
jgi:thiamine-phosphate pyrophosphorylase